MGNRRDALPPNAQSDTSEVWLIEPIDVRHPVHRNMIEHYDEENGGRCWEMTLEGLDTRIVIPKDYNIVREVQTT